MPEWEIYEADGSLYGSNEQVGLKMAPKVILVNGAA
jgi:hypothetical protein